MHANLFPNNKIERIEMGDVVVIHTESVHLHLDEEPMEFLNKVTEAYENYLTEKEEKEAADEQPPF